MKKVGNRKQPVKNAKEAKQIHVNLWQHKDIQNADNLSRWTFPEFVRDLHDSPVTLFELFMTGKLTDHIYKDKTHTLLKRETTNLKFISRCSAFKWLHTIR